MILEYKSKINFADILAEKFEASSLKIEKEIIKLHAEKADLKNFDKFYDNATLEFEKNKSLF